LNSKKVVSVKNWQLLLVGLVLVVILAGAFLSTSGKTKAYADDASPVYYFWRADCHYCQQQDPILSKLAEEGFRVRVMDVGANPALFAQYGVEGTPTFIADYGKGDKKVGLTQESELRAWLLAHGAKIKTS